MLVRAQAGQDSKPGKAAVKAFALRIYFMLAGSVVGAFIGAGIGIAAFGTAIAGTFPLGIIAGIVGYRSGFRVQQGLWRWRGVRGTPPTVASILRKRYGPGRNTI